MMSLYSSSQQWRIDAFCRENDDIFTIVIYVKNAANMLAKKRCRAG